MKYNLLLCIILFPLFIFGQDVEQSELVSNNIFVQFDVVEAFSINYERRIISKDIATLNFNVGISHSLKGYPKKILKWVGVPISVICVFGKNNNHFETGLGFWPVRRYNSISNFDNTSENFYQFKVGYRHQKLREKGFNYRIGASPTFYKAFYVDHQTSGFYFTFYINAGYSF